MTTADTAVAADVDACRRIDSSGGETPIQGGTGMCYGFDGEAALERAAESSGVGRRTFISGAIGAAVTAGVAASAVGGAASAQARANNTNQRRVPLDRISIQL